MHTCACMYCMQLTAGLEGEAVSDTAVFSLKVQNEKMMLLAVT